MPRHLPAVLLLLMLSWPGVAPAAATGTNDQGITLPPLAQPLPAPFLSASGQFSSPNSPNQFICHKSDVTGRVVSYRVIAENAIILSAEEGDPPAAPVQASTSFMMCQPPKLDALASQLGRELCVQSTLVANMGVTGSALEAAARAPIPGSPRDAAPGDPTTITCRVDLEHSDAHLTAIASARNNHWAWWVGKQQNPLN